MRRLAFLLALLAPTLGWAQAYVYPSGTTWNLGRPGVLVLGVRNDAGAALCNNLTMCSFTFDNTGALRVTGGGGGGGGTSSSFGAAFPGTGTASGFSDGTNMQGGRVFDADTGGGTQYVLGAYLRKPGAGGSVDFGTSTDPIRIDPTGTTTQPVSSTQLPAALVGARLDINNGAWLGSTAPTVGQKTMANSLPVAIASDQSAVPISGTVTTTPPSNASTNVAQFGGNNVVTGTGASGVGIPRVTLSSDSSLAANQSVNLAQVAGTNTVTGGLAGSQGVGGLVASGAAISGNPVIIGGGSVAGGTNATAATVKAASTAAAATDTSLVTQGLINGAAMVTATTGVQRVGIVGGLAGGGIDTANNNSAPANVIAVGFQMQSNAAATNGTAGQVGNGLMGLDHVLYARVGGPVTWSCFVEAVTVTTQCRAAPGAGIKAYVTSMACSNEAATVQGVDVVFGTGANCATGTTALTHKFQMGTNATTTSPFVVEHTFSSPLNPTAANAVCVRPTAATAFGCTLTGYDAP